MDEIDLAMEKLDPLYEERHRLESTMIEEAEAGNFEMPEINRLEDTLERDHVVLRFA